MPKFMIIKTSALGLRVINKSSSLLVEFKVLGIYMHMRKNEHPKCLSVKFLVNNFFFLMMIN